MAKIKIKKIKKWTKDLNQHFTQEDIQITNRYMKRCTKSLIIREMQTKTTMVYHLTPARVASIIKKTRDTNCFQGCEEKRIFVYNWWKCKLLPLLWKTVWSFLKQLKIEPPCDTAIPLLSVHPKETKPQSQRDIYIPCLLHHYSH